LQHFGLETIDSGSSVNLLPSSVRGCKLQPKGYLVFELTHSPVFLGYVGFASGAPSLLTLVGGVVSDRFPRKTILIITQVVMMLLAFILALLTFTGTINSWHIVVMAFALGIANAFDAPARQSIVIDFVDREHLTNAIASEFVRCLMQPGRLVLLLPVSHTLN
jgi:MFS family permease